MTRLAKCMKNNRIEDEILDYNYEHKHSGLQYVTPNIKYLLCKVAGQSDRCSIGKRRKKMRYSIFLAYPLTYKKKDNTGGMTRNVGDVKKYRLQFCTIQKV